MQTLSAKSSVVLKSQKIFGQMNIIRTMSEQPVSSIFMASIAISKNRNYQVQKFEAFVQNEAKFCQPGT